MRTCPHTLDLSDLQRASLSLSLPLSPNYNQSIFFLIPLNSTKRINVREKGKITDSLSLTGILVENFRSNFLEILFRFAATMTEPPENRRQSAENPGEVQAGIERETGAENGGGEKEVERTGYSVGDRFEVQSGEASGRDNPANVGGSESPGLS